MKVAATQMSCSWDVEANLDKAEILVREAVSKGANIVLLPELFDTPYFPKDQDPDYFKLARPLVDHPTLIRMSALAKDLGVVLPVSVFERANNSFFNSLVMIDSDGTNLGVYRKAHIPDGPGYQEKFYFSPGDSEFKPFQTKQGCIGVGICWDQWFPETARALTLEGADILLYPTAIGSEPPPAKPLDSSGHWRRVMQGHSAANIIPVVASNRIGLESGESADVTFYGASFITDETGQITHEVGSAEGVAVASFDLEAIRGRRHAWGLFRDRRPELYRRLASL